MKNFNQFVGKEIADIIQNDDGKNSYFIIKFTDGSKMNIVGYIRDDKNNTVNLKAKTYESSQTNKVYIEENIQDFIDKSKKLDESFVNITINIGKDDTVSFGSTSIPDNEHIIGVEPVESEDQIDSEITGDAYQSIDVSDDYDDDESEEESEEDYDEEDYDEEEPEEESEEDYDEEESEEESEEDYDEEESEEDYDEEESEEDYDEEDYDEEESEEENYIKIKEDYDEEESEEDENIEDDYYQSDEDEDEEFDEDTDFDEIDVKNIESEKNMLDDTDDDEENLPDDDIETVLNNQLSSPEFNREIFNFADIKSGNDYSGIVLAKLSNGYFLFKTNDGIKKVHHRYVYEN